MLTKHSTSKIYGSLKDILQSMTGRAPENALVQMSRKAIAHNHIMASLPPVLTSRSRDCDGCKAANLLKYWTNRTQHKNRCQRFKHLRTCMFHCIREKGRQIKAKATSRTTYHSGTRDFWDGFPKMERVEIRFWRSFWLGNIIPAVIQCAQYSVWGKLLSCDIILLLYVSLEGWNWQMIKTRRKCFPNPLLISRKLVEECLGCTELTLRYTSSVNQ